MATKKVSAKTVVAEKPVKTATVAPVSVEPTVKASAPKTAAPAKTAKKEIAKSKVTFMLPKEAVENAETVAVLGDFNNWKTGVELKKQKDGSFQGAVELEKGRSYEFRFLINGQKWENAWNAESYKPTPFGVYNSVVTA